MRVEDDLIRQGIVRIASVSGISMDPDALVEDVLILASVFDNEHDFLSAVLAVERACKHLVSGAVNSGKLKYDLEGWRSYHFQPAVAQGAKATLRIIWQPTEDGIRIRGFGHRKIPGDIYKRLSETR